jgi:hypothetical protein
MERRGSLFQLYGAIAGSDTAAVIARGFDVNAVGGQESCITPALHLRAGSAAT